MRYTGESVPGFGDQLLDEMEAGHSHGGNDTNETNKTRETTEESTSVVEETPILNDPEGASDDALFGIDSNGETMHGDEDEPVLYKKGKRIVTSEEQVKKKRNKNKVARKTEPLVSPTVLSTENEANEGEKATSDIEFAKPMSDAEFEKKKQVQKVIEQIADFLSTAEFIPADLYIKAQALNDPFLNKYILTLPDETVVFMDDNADKSKTIFEIKQHAAVLAEQKKNTPIEDETKTETLSPQNTTEIDAKLVSEIGRKSEIKEGSPTPPQRQEQGQQSNRPRRNTASRGGNSQWGKSVLSSAIFSNNQTAIQQQQGREHSNEKHHEEPNTHKTKPSENILRDTETITHTPNITPEKFEPTTQQESQPSNLERLFTIAQTKDDLIAIVAKSANLESGLQGTHQVYSKDDLIALIEATWIGDVGIDHLPRTAGFREAVDRVRERERESGKFVEERTTAEEIEPLIQTSIKNADTYGVPEDSRIYDHDKENNSFVYNYTNYPRTETNRKKNTSIVQRLWSFLRGKR